MKKLLLFSAAILFLQSNMLAQAPDTLWTKIYGIGDRRDEGNSIHQTSDGGYIIAGSTDGGGQHDVYLIKTDSSGDTLWTKTYGGKADEWGNASWDEGNSVQQTSDGGFIITGKTGDPLFNSDVYLIKTDSSGDTLWTKSFGGYHFEVGKSVQQTNDGGYIIVGSTHSGGPDVYLIKTDPSGDTLWTKTYGRSNSEDEGNSVQQTSDGGYIIAGFTSSGSHQSVYLIKTDISGDTLWTKTYGGNNSWDRGNSVQQTNDGGYIIVGNKGPLYSDDNSDIYLIKTDSSGDTIWTKTVGGIYDEEGNSVQQTSDGGYIITGIFQDSYYNSDVYIIKTNSSGETLWTKTYGESNSRDVGNCVQHTSDGGYIITGAHGYDAYLIKLATEFPTAVRSYDNQILFNYGISQNYPNPFNPATKISWQSPVSSRQVLKVHDVLGNEVATLVNEYLSTGSYEIEFNASNLPSGVYFYQLQVGSFVQTKKMILMK